MANQSEIDLLCSAITLSLFHEINKHLEPLPMQEHLTRAMMICGRLAVGFLGMMDAEGRHDKENIELFISTVRTELAHLRFAQQSDEEDSTAVH